MYKTTPIPNEILDQHLRHLNQSQMKILFTVLRQTLGWIDPKTKRRKAKDWISHTFFQRRTGLTTKSISIAIQELINKELIVAMDTRENELRYPQNRKGKKRIYYAYAPYFRAIKKKSIVETITDLFTFPPYTKETHTKRYSGNRTQRKSDRERIEQILRLKQ